MDNIIVRLQHLSIKFAMFDQCPEVVQISPGDMEELKSLFTSEGPELRLYGMRIEESADVADGEICVPERQHSTLKGV